MGTIATVLTPGGAETAEIAEAVLTTNHWWRTIVTSYGATTGTTAALDLQWSNAQIMRLMENDFLPESLTSANMDWYKY